MITDSIHYKTISQIIHDGTWNMEKIHIPSDIWNALRNKSNEQNLQPEVVLALVAIFSLKTRLDLPDQEIDGQINLLSKNNFYSIPLNPFTENTGFNRNFLKHCNDLYHSMTVNAEKLAESPTNKFLIVLNDASSDFKIPVENPPSVLITITVTEVVQIDWYVNPEFLNEERIKSLAETHHHLLKWFSKEDWKQPFPDLLSKEGRTIRDKVNQTSTEIKSQLIHQGFFQHALKHPQDTALCWDNNHMSYGELAEIALKLSRALVDKGAEQGSRVAIILPKGPSQIIAVMGVLGSGALYIPIGVEQPVGRQEKILKKAEVKFIVSNTSTLLDFPHLRDLAQEQHITILNPDEISEVKPLDTPVDSNVNQPAYIIFTSGSTGEPKGVEISHAAAWNTIQDINTKFNINSSDRTLAISALDFDLSVYDIFGLLAVGGSLVLIREEERKEASIWLNLVEKHKITVWNSVPALFDMLLLSSSAENDLSGLRLILVSGDWVGLDLKNRIKERSGNCQLIALGGATEASIWSNFFPVDEVNQNWKSIPYGKPLANQKYRVVNHLGTDCPDGIIGELWIGGKGVASGYTNNKELTNRSFVTVNSERWYRTGDLGRYWPDGNLEFLGRIDHQVKVNGFRIELGEIESALKTFIGVSQAIVVVLSVNRSAHLAAGVVAEKVLSANEMDYTLLTPTVSHTSNAEYELQKQLIATFLYDLLGLSKHTVKHTINDYNNSSSKQSLWVQLKQLREQLIKEMDIATEQFPILDMWLNWLDKENILTEKDGQLIFVAEFSPIGYDNIFLNTFREKLNERKPLLCQILSNILPPISLLDDELLSPEVLSTHDKSILKGIELIAEKINQAVTQSEKSVKIALLGARTAILTEKLLKATQVNKIEYSVIDEGHAIVHNFTKRLSEAGYNINGIELKHNQIPEEYWYHFDFVVAINTLHRFPQPEQGVFISNLLLDNGGRLLAVEAELLMPVGLISSGVIDRGFQHFDQQRRETFSPVLNKEFWRDYFLKTGFIEVHAEYIQDSSTILYDTHCPEKRHQLKESNILSHIQALLPPHMLPEKVAILPSIPLSLNGKTDRKAFAELVRTMVEANVRKSTEDFEKPIGKMEEDIAAIWKELLVLETVSRNDIFFETGGDSLSATRFLTEVKKQFEVSLSLRELFGTALKDVAAKVQMQHLKLQQELETMETGEI